MDRAFFFPVFIARPENNAKNSAPQSVNYCVTDFRRTPVRLQICSLQFALCSTAFFALFSGLAISVWKITLLNKKSNSPGACLKKGFS